MGKDMRLLTNSRRIAYSVNGAEGVADAKDGIAIRWHGASAIHRWFVDNVQGGRDDGGIYQVKIEDLVRLHDTCCEVLESTALVDEEIYLGEVEYAGLRVAVFDREKSLADKTLADKLLPDRCGYDEWYWRDLAMTARKIGEILDALEPDMASPWRVHHRDEPGWNVKFYYTSR
jgi:hypothetical protein